MKIFASLLSAFLVLSIGLVVSAPAAVVGRLTQVEGQVDFLKGGKLPASPAKAEDGVEVGDVLRTKSLSKAQITFMDNTVLTISPESRIAVEEYMFDQGQGKRNAVLQLFQGLAHVAVTKIFQMNDPDFIVKTHTAVMGVRGTEVGIRLSPNDSTFLNFKGLTRVANIFPEVSGDLFRKAAKVAFSFGNSGFVDLKDMQGTVVIQGLPPTLPFGITDQDRQMFNRQLGGVFAQQRAAQGSSAGTGGGGDGGAIGGGSGLAGGSTLPTSSTLGSLNPLNNVPNLLTQVITQTVTPPPVVTQSQRVTPPVSTFSFSESWTGPALLTVTTQPTANFTATGPGNGTITSLTPASATLFPNGFTVSNLLVQATLTNPGVTWNNGWTGSYNVTATGTLSGPAKGNMTGTMNMSLILPGDKNFTLQGPITYNSGSGKLTYNFQYNSQNPTKNVFNSLNGSGHQGTVPTGAITQLKKP